jgi:uncharacterized membrane protein YhaH (DUF805 family)
MSLLQELLPRGRLTRSGFWLRHFTLVPAALWLTTVAGRWPQLDLAAAVLATLILISIWGRRLHDRGRSAWCLLAVIVPVLGALVLLIECALRGSRDAAPAPGRDYVTV